MFNQSISSPEKLPVREANRKSTDVCCTIAGAIIALTIFIFACIFFNKGNLNKAYWNNVSSSDGTPCHAGQAVSYSDLNDLTKRSCVASCPNGFYNSNGVCYPNDSTLNAKYLSNQELTRQWDYDAFKTTLFWTALAALSLGLIWLAVTHFLARQLPIISIIVTVILLIVIGVLVIISNKGFFYDHSTWKILIAITAFVLAIIIAVMGIYYGNEAKLQGFFLAYANRFLVENPYTFLYIPIYIILCIGLVALFIFQHCAFSSKNSTSTNFFDFSNPGFWGVLNILEFIWGLQFLRDAFNFCVSGNAVDWYWSAYEPVNQSTQRVNTHWYSSLTRLLTKNWGSVVGGSFLNAFFEIPTLLVELLTCHPTTCCGKLGTICYNDCSCLGSFFRLVRTDAYSYINLSGIPFCTAARECSKLCTSSNLFVGNYSPLKHQRFVAHVLLVAISVVIGYLIASVRLQHVSRWGVITLIVVVYMVVTWFIGIFTDSAEGIETSFLAEHYASTDYQYMERAYPSFRKEIEQLGNRESKIRDGNC